PVAGERRQTRAAGSLIRRLGRAAALVLSFHLGVAIEPDELEIERGERKIKLVWVLEADGYAATAGTAGAGRELHMELHTGVGFAASKGSTGHRRDAGSGDSAIAVCGRAGRDLGRIELRGHER